MVLDIFRIMPIVAIYILFGFLSNGYAQKICVYLPHVSATLITTIYLIVHVILEILSQIKISSKRGCSGINRGVPAHSPA